MKTFVSKLQTTSERINLLHYIYLIHSVSRYFADSDYSAVVLIVTCYQSGVVVGGTLKHYIYLFDLQITIIIKMLNIGQMIVTLIRRLTCEHQHWPVVNPGDQ